MASSINGLSAYQQTSSWTSESAKLSEKTRTEPAVKKPESKVNSWNPPEKGSSLIPKSTTEYGTVIGDVKLSEGAKDYYDKLKEKFGNAEFILVSKDMKNSVQQNAAAYGNALKMVVLIDEEKLERMATDEEYRKKYEGIIAMSQNKLAAAKTSLTSSGASITNFGMSVDSEGKESFFATMGKAMDAQRERIAQKRAEKKAAQKAELKKEKKQEFEERIENQRKEKDYLTVEADSVEELVREVQNYSAGSAWENSLTEAEKTVGQHIDFKG